MNPFSLDAADSAFDLETPSSGSHQTLFPSTPIATPCLSDISSFILSSMAQEESQNPSHVIRNNLTTILSFLPICSSLFILRLVSQEWNEAIMDIRREIYEGKISIPLLTFAKHKNIINDTMNQSNNNNNNNNNTDSTTSINITPQSYQQQHSSSNQSELNVDFPLILLENLCDNEPLIGPKTHIETVELLGLTIPEMEYVLKRLVVAQSGIDSGRSTKLTTMPPPPTPSSGLLMDTLDAFPPTPSVFKSAAINFSNSSNSPPLIKNLVIGWPNTTLENNFSIPNCDDRRSGAPLNSQIFSLSALDTSESQIQPPNDDDDDSEDSEDSDMDDFIEYGDDNPDYTTTSAEAGADTAAADEEDHDPISTLKTTVSFNPNTIAVLQSIESILIIDATNERNLINYDILVDSFHAEASSSVDLVEFQVDGFSKNDYSKFNHLLDFIFFNTKPSYTCKMKFLRNPFFYYAEDSYYDMVNSELKPYITALQECKSCGPLIHYSRCLLYGVISSEYVIDIRFLKESWDVLLKPLYENNLLNWTDPVYKVGRERCDVIQTTLKKVYELYATPNSISNQLFKNDLLSSFSSTYSSFLENEVVILALNILETLAEWKRNVLPTNSDNLQSYNSNHHFTFGIKPASFYIEAIDQFFSNVIKTMSSSSSSSSSAEDGDEARQVRSWADLLESGQKRSLPSSISTTTTPESKKKRIQL